MMMPNFIIVGSAKAGTTSLFNYLSQHPDVFMPKWKEPSFFIGDKWGPLHRVRKSSCYYRLFRKAEGYKAVGEASTSYLYDKASPELIKQKLGLIKIIVLLRDPVDMSYSLYNHQFRREGEWLKTFRLALEAEPGRISDPEFCENCYGWHANYNYFHRGLYSQQVKRYLDLFGPENVKIILFDKFKTDPAKVSQEICRFIGVDDTFKPVLKVHNPSGRIVAIPKFWEDYGLFQKTLSFIFSGNLIKKIPHLIRSIGRKPPVPVDAETSKKLRERFYDDICCLEQLIDEDLSAWKHNAKPIPSILCDCNLIESEREYNFHAVT